MRPATAGVSASRATVCSSVTKTAPASGTPSTSSGFSRIRRSSRLCRSVRSRPTSRAIAATTIASCERWSTRPRRGQDRYLLVRNGGGNNSGRLEAYQIDMNTCLVQAHSEPTDYNIQTHEFFLWHDPANANRVIAYVTNWTGGVPDAEHPGLKMPDALVMAMTDESTGEMLPKAKFLAGFSLQDVGGPPINEKPDATGLFSDGRFLDFSALRNRSGRGGNFQNAGAEPPALAFRQRRWRACVRGGDDGGVLHPEFGGSRAPHRRGAGRGHGRVQPALDRSLLPTNGAHRRGASCRRSPATASTW